MAELSLVVKQGSLTGMAESVRTTHDALVGEVEAVLSGVRSRTAGWSEGTDSRAAEMAYQERLRNGVTELGELLAKIGTTLTTIAEDAHTVEVENVALVD